MRNEITSAEPGSQNENKKKNDYIKSADAVRGEASLVGLMGTTLYDVGIEISSTMSDSTPPHSAPTTRSAQADDDGADK